MQPLYRSETQDIYIPATWLGFPVVVETLPVWMAFGPLGHYIVHELTHAFERAAREHSKIVKGTTGNKDWYDTVYLVRLTSERTISLSPCILSRTLLSFFPSLSLLQEAYQCFKEFIDPRNRKRRTGYVFEVMHDHVATVISFESQRFHLAYFPKARTRMLGGYMGFESYRKLFFISKAYLQCWATNFWREEKFDSHPPRFKRINGGFANYARFRDTFGCRMDDKMVNDPPCKIFHDESSEDVGYDY